MSQALAKLVLSPMTRVVYRPVVIGRENVPRTGPVIIASNHLAAIDSAVIPLVAPRPVSFLAKAEYFTGEGVKGAVNKVFFSSMGSIPVERGTHRAAQAALDAGLSVLQEGGAFGIYPEGTRSRDGRLYKGRTGVAWLALASGAPVVPVALTGTERIQPVGKLMPRIRRITVQFGKPLDFSDRIGISPVGPVRRAITDEIMEAIHAMSAQPLSGTYNEHQKADE